MSNLYHKDIYKFDEPVKSYWETTSDTNNKYNKLEKNIQTNIVVIGGGYTGISCALSLAKNYNEDVVLVEAGHIGWGSSARNAGFCCIYPAKMSVATMFKKFGKEETKKFFNNTIEGSNFTKNLIEENGFLILEVEYLSNFIKNIQFERFYFDRPFYYSLLSIKILFQQVGMSLVNVEHINTHGGSIRCYIKNSKDEKSTSLVEDILKIEKLHLNIETFKNFQKKIIKETTNLKDKLNYFKRSKKKVIGYGAPARVSTITNFANIDYNHIDFIIDDSPLKQDRYTPGTHIPIISRKKSKSNNVDIIIVFAYEYFKEIKELTKNYNCEYFQPIPFSKLS